MTQGILRMLSHLVVKSHLSHIVQGILRILDNQFQQETHSHIGFHILLMLDNQFQQGTRSHIVCLILRMRDNPFLLGTHSRINIDNQSYTSMVSKVVDSQVVTLKTLWNFNNNLKNLKGTFESLFLYLNIVYETFEILYRTARTH